MTDLPNGWEKVTIGMLCELINGRAFKPSDWTNKGLPIVRIQNLNNPEASYNHYSGEVKEKFLIDKGQLLFAWSGTPGTSFGAHVWNGGKAVLNQHIFKVEFDEDAVDRDFFQFAINQKLQELIDKAHGGVGLRHVTKGKFEETEIELPPLTEQRRIVAKLDSLLDRTRRAREELAHVPTLIEHYKQAILAAAFRGDLTADWRAINKISLSGWKTLPFSQVVDEGPNNGYSPRSAENGAGPLTLKLTATTKGVLNLDEHAVKRVIESVPDDSKFWLRPGDMLIQRANSIEYLGATAIFEGPEHTYIYPDLMMRVRIYDAWRREYLWRYLNSYDAREYLRARATGTAGNMPKINNKTLNSLPIPIPSNEEIIEIVLKLRSVFKFAEKIKQEVKRTKYHLDSLSQAILAKAFQGELVPQDPDDEPASTLLERIRTAQADSPNLKSRGRKPRKNAVEDA